MNEAFKAFILGLVQGLTEFLPISSSFHLRLIPNLLGWQEMTLAFSAFLHLGTLLAVLIYFYRDLSEITKEALNISNFFHSMGFKIFIGCLPAICIGLAFHDKLEQLDNNFTLTTIVLIVFSFFIWLGDNKINTNINIQELSKKSVFIIGCGQALALIPGVSRSGATITAGRFLGLNREKAARFSFLLGFPVILGAGLLESFKLFKTQLSSQEILICLIGFFTAAICGYFVIAFFLKLLQNFNLLPFIIYRIIIGLLLLIFKF